MKVALCFWGLARSLRITYKSIENRVLKVLKRNKIPYKIFMHTYEVNSLLNNSRTGERGVKLNNKEYKILNADYVEVDNQEEVKKKLNLKQYRTKRDPWNTGYKSVDNFVLAMYSKKRLWEIIEKSGENCTHYIFLRPDVKYRNNLMIKWLRKINNQQILIPLANQYKFRFNDRFAICKYEVAKIYSNLYPYMLKYSKIKPLHSETFNREMLIKLKRNIKIFSILFFFNLVRSNGKENNCTGKYNKLINKINSRK